MLRLGIVGIGRIAEDYIELISGGKVTDVRLAALCSRRMEHARETADRYHLNVSVYQDYDAFLRSGELDAVLISTPHGQHPGMTRGALERGIHVLVEKPVGIFADEVEELLPLLRQNPAPVCGVLYNRRASKAFRYVKELMDGGAIGELARCTWVLTNLYRTDAYYTSGSWRGAWASEGGGLLMTQASHQLDLMQWLCGMPVSVRARCAAVGRRIAVENEAELFLTFPNGAHGQFIASAHECPGSNLLELCGTKGKITVRDDMDVTEEILSADERAFAKESPGPFAKPPFTRAARHFDDSDNKIQQAATIQNFVSAVSKREKLQCTLEEGLHSLRIIHGAYLSDWEKREIALPAPEIEFRKQLAAR